MSYADLFCGIGGFHQAASQLGLQCVFACDVDPECRRAYKANYGIEPAADIREVAACQIPALDLVLAGFPCQPFSIIGRRHGLEDARGTLFFELARVVEAKRPAAFVFENVRQLASHDRGATLARMVAILEGLGYKVEHRVLNALDHGLPQKRERLILVGLLGGGRTAWPQARSHPRALADILEPFPDRRHYASPRVREARALAHTASHRPAIWHENKAGNVTSHPFSCALRAGASYNYLLVDGERRLTPREMLRLQGFPDTFEIVCSDSQTRRQAGNAVPVPLALAGLQAVLGASRADP